MPNTNEDIIRVLRVLEYVGPRSWVESTLEQNAIKGERVFARDEDGKPVKIIHEAVVGTFPEIWEKTEVLCECGHPVACHAVEGCFVRVMSEGEETYCPCYRAVGVVPYAESGETISPIVEAWQKEHPAK